MLNSISESYIPKFQVCANHRHWLRYYRVLAPVVVGAELQQTVGLLWAPLLELWSHVCAVKTPSYSRRSAFFCSYRCLLTGCREHANVVKVPLQQGLRAYQTTVCVSPNNRSRLRKSCRRVFCQGHCWGKVRAPILANIAPEKYLCTKGLQRIGAHGAMFFMFQCIYPAGLCGSSSV